MRCTNNIDSLNALRRAQYYSSQNNYKPVHYTVMEEQFVAAVAARLEAEKFELFLGAKGKEWPPEMRTARTNLLRTSLFDDAVESNRNNPLDLLPPIWDLYKTTFPSTCAMDLARFKTRTVAAGQDLELHPPSSLNAPEQGEILSTVPIQDGNASDSALAIRESPGDQEDTENSNRIGASTGEEQETGSHLSSSPLDERGIQHHQMTWEQYERTICNSDGDEYRPLFDFVLSDPPTPYRAPT